MKKTSFFLFILFSFFSFAQSPPPVAMPKGNQEKLIDELITISNYEKSLKEYSTTYLYGKMNKKVGDNYIKILSFEDIKNIVREFDFEKFKKSTIYNSFSMVSEKNLKFMIDFYKNIDGNLTKHNELFFISQAINNNLTAELDDAIEKIEKTKLK